jgi:hypothetical protein
MAFVLWLDSRHEFHYLSRQNFYALILSAA